MCLGLRSDTLSLLYLLLHGHKTLAKSPSLCPWNSLLCLCFFLYLLHLLLMTSVCAQMSCEHMLPPACLWLHACVRECYNSWWPVLAQVRWMKCLNVSWHNSLALSGLDNSICLTFIHTAHTHRYIRTYTFSWSWKWTAAQAELLITYNTSHSKERPLRPCRDGVRKTEKRRTDGQEEGKEIGDERQPGRCK